MQRSDVWFIAVVAAILGFIAGLAWTDFRGEGNPLEAYQTLIVGLAAVAAAYATINAMNRTDEKAQKRHDQLVNLTLRADKLACQRAAYTAGTFNAIAFEIERLRRTADEVRVSPELALTASAVAGTIKLACESPAIQEAVRLFGPKMTMTFHALLNTCENADVKSDVVIRLTRSGTSDTARALITKANDLIAFLYNFVRPRVAEFADQLHDIGQEYI